MPKRLRYLISSVLAALTFFGFISLPYEVRYYALMVGIVLIMAFYWFGLGIIWEKSLYFKMVPTLMPLGWFVGFGSFVVLLPLSFWSMLLFSIFFGFICYVIFLVENIYFVAIGYKTVPLYRAAYTVSLILLLMMAFFMFNTMFSYQAAYWINGLATAIISFIIFLYQFWAITIELPNDGKELSLRSYTLIPSLVMGQLAIAFSFWPVGIFKGSIFLVSAIYVLSGLLQADIRDRLFRKTWEGYLWAGGAILFAVLLVTRWG